MAASQTALKFTKEEDQVVKPIAVDAEQPTAAMYRCADAELQTKECVYTHPGWRAGLTVLCMLVPTLIFHTLSAHA
jgi:hypothetical protein